jgi:1-acyl-sn-glycerol-3-phosphate acyltransferase
MDTPPPRWVRRLFVTPLVFVCALGLVLASPLIHLAAAVLDLIFDRGRWRLSRFVGIGLAFCFVEVFGLFTLLTVWVGSGFGRYMSRPFWVRANSVLVGQYLELITRAIRFYLGFGFHYTYEPIPAGRQLMFPRHAGPGDAFMIARVVVRDARRRLHMVGAEKLQWDPFLDIAGERLSFHYLHQNPNDTSVELDSIRALASGMGDDETLVIFPEGGNYTTERKERQIEALTARGREEDARLAAQLRHTLLPKIGGVMAALEGAPDANVLFVAHAGLEGLHGFGDLWSAVPIGHDMVAHSWTVVAADRLSDDDTQAERSAIKDWICREWRKVDEWIDQRIVHNRAN